jgi:ethanolamine utilization protein EutA (predicted chaperonin)
MVGMTNKGGCKSSGKRSHGKPRNQSHGSKKTESSSQGNNGSKEKSCDKNNRVLSMLLKLGVGTTNIRIFFGGKVRSGVYLGIVDESVVINVKGSVNYISISSIIAVEIGLGKKKKKKKKKRSSCRKTICF